MPTVEFDFQELNSLLGRKFKPQELMHRISMLGVDMESIDNDKIIMEIFPDRPDMLGIEGFARALKGTLEIEKGLPVYSAEDSGIKLFVDSSVNRVRPFIVAGIIREISFTQEKLVSLMDIQEKLHITHGRNRKKVAIGVHDMSRIEAPFFYKAVNPTEISFIPLDMKEELNLNEILKKHPKGRDFAWVLEGLERYPIILDKNKNVLSFPPIINGELTRVNEATTDMFIEVTGLDQRAVNQALNILMTSIVDRGGKAYTVEILEIKK